MGKNNVIRIYVNCLSDYLDCNLEQIEKIENLVTILQDDNVEKILLNITITHTKKIAFLQAILEELSIEEKICKFIEYILCNRKEKLLIQILQEYIVAAYAKSGIKKITIIVAKKISDIEKQKIQERLEKLWNFKLFIVYKVDSNVLSGMIISKEDKILDLSYRKKLQIVNEIISNSIDKSQIFTSLEQKKFDNAKFSHEKDI